MSAAPRQRHLVTVWNPAYGRDALHAHARILLDRLAGADRAGDMDDAFVWWGKIRSANRQQALPHLDEILQLDETLTGEDGAEMHLYLTDYRSLYVGHVGGIRGDDVRIEDAEHVPDYYRQRDMACDCWFQLWDLRRVVQDDTLAVVAELKKLRNVHYHDRPVSLYGGMVDLPLVAWREDDARFFDPVERERVLGDRYWVEFDAEYAGTGAMERELRENLLGEAAWGALELGTRTFVATAERIFRDNRSNAAFDFAPVLGGFAKALEVECNARLRRGLLGAPAERRQANVEGRTLDLGTRQHLSLGQLARAIGGERALNHALVQRLRHGDWFANQLPPILDAFREVRNEGAHELPIDRETAVYWRNRLVGVGCQGVLVDLAEVRAK